MKTLPAVPPDLVYDPYDHEIDANPEWSVDERGVEMVHTTTVRRPARAPVRV